MNTPQEMIAQLTQTQAGFSKSERKVVTAILSNPEAATRSSIAQLARLSTVSEPTINRFLQKARRIRVS